MDNKSDENLMKTAISLSISKKKSVIKKTDQNSSKNLKNLQPPQLENEKSLIPKKIQDLFMNSKKLIENNKEDKIFDYKF